MKQNEQIIILGNGPSLQTAYFHLLSGKKSLGMNAAYRYWDQIDFYPNFYCCLDDQVVVSHAWRIRELIAEKRCEAYFLATDILKSFPELANMDSVFFLPQMRPGPVSEKQCKELGLVHRPSKFFGSDFPAKLTTGSYSVRFAAEMGYTDIGLIGIDCRYIEIIDQARAEQGIALSIAETPDENPNYFFADYQRAGDRYNIPNPSVHDGNLHLQSFEALNADFQKRKFPVKITNCARKSELYAQRIFPYEPIRKFLNAPRPLGLFIPFVEKDVPSILKNMETWSLQAYAPYEVMPEQPAVELHFAFNGGPAKEIEKAIEGQFERLNLSLSFASLHFHYSHLAGLRDLYTRNFSGEYGPEGYMAGPNNQFFDIITKFSAGLSYIHIVEADVMPTRCGWLSALEGICHTSDGFWICGSHYRGAGDVKALWHINGNAFYNVGSAEFQDFFKHDFLEHFYNRIKQVPSLAYDIVLYDMMKSALLATDPDQKTIRIWQKIAHRVRFSEHIVDLSHTDDFSPENLHTIASITSKFPKAILAHGAIHERETAPRRADDKAKVKTKANRKNMTSDAQVLFVEPDGKDDNGHYFSYTNRLSEACAAKGYDFSVLARSDANHDLLPSSTDVIPCFSTHSWSVGNRRDGLKPQASKTFQSELKAGLAAANVDGYKATHVYMYYGSLEHARTIHETLKEIPSTHATINLFWASFIDDYDVKYVNRFRSDVWAMVDDPRITLTAPTHQTAAALEKVFGVTLPVAPHPSPTFDDEQVAAFEVPTRDKNRTQTKVVFPGGMRIEKGFDLTCSAANLLAEKAGLDIVIRTAQESADKHSDAAIATLKTDTVSRKPEKLSDLQFRDFLASADIIVCPYTESAFKQRTSGLVVDAMVLSCPIVVLEGTWLAKFVEQHQIGLAVAPRAESIAAAVEEIASNPDQYIAAADGARAQYLRKDSWGALVKSIVHSDLEAPDSAAEIAPGEEEEIIAELPPYIRAPIFLPTDRLPPKSRVQGLKRVRDLYKNGDLEQEFNPKLRGLKAGRHAKRCFVIGNGPSLKKTDLALLKDEVTFAMNSFFLKLHELQWEPTYYVVEDHLVAEDRAKEINRLRGPTKLFPASLRYVIEPDEKTIFFDHRPRVSYPDGFDFSFDADKNTFAGGTVTFTCMQLAAYMGFEEIYLIGVDASYSIPKDATVSGPGRVKEIDMESDDPNHFHPDYFGKGKRWHEPNVDVMLKAYEEALKATQKRGQKILNATVGGELEVFPRVEFSSLFAKKEHPRLLVIDLTRIGDISATGELKATLLKGWPEARQAQLYLAGADKITLKTSETSKNFDDTLLGGIEDIEAAVNEYNPELILYRPTPNTAPLHAIAMSLIKKSTTPLATWIMDDWPTSFAAENPKSAADLAVDFRWLLHRSNVRLSISDQMSKAMGARYGVDFTPIANGVSPSDWPKSASRAIKGKFKVRYAGSLAENMTLASIRSIGMAVERLAESGLNIGFEIKTREVWKNLAEPTFKNLQHTEFIVDDLPATEYREWLSEADVVTIGYNFDRKSRAYTRFSLANKLPECLASGAPLLAIGPADSATLSVLAEHECGLLVTEDSVDKIASALTKLHASRDLRETLSNKGQSVAFRAFNLNSARKKFRDHLTLAATLPPGGDGTGLPRDVGARVDETGVVAHMLSQRRGGKHVMLDVGAHYGSSAEYFHALDWSIHCFEPDPSNRQELLTLFGDTPNITIDPRAVSDQPATGLNFFTSDESTGISGLHAFHKTHAVTALVDATTIEAIADNRKLTKVDFLKIDVEGYDLNVLKGVPWETLKPDVIECEFEDNKTLKLGHNWRHIARFLVTRGYAVYISEWHPIVRYGIAHEWKRVVPFENCELAPDAWGNILAFKQDPGYEEVFRAFEELLTYRMPKAIQNDKALLKSSIGITRQKTRLSNHAKQNESYETMLQRTPDRAIADLRKEASAKSNAVGGMWYSGIAHKIQQVSPALFGILRFARRAMAHVFSRPLLLICLILLGGIMAWVTMDARFDADRGWIFGGVLAGVLALVIGYVASRAQLHIQKLHDEFNQMTAEVTRVRKDLAMARTQLDRVGSTRSKTAIENEVKTSLLTSLKASEHRQEQSTEALRAKLVNVWTSQQERCDKLQALSEGLQERYNELQASSEGLQERSTGIENLQQASNEKRVALSEKLNSTDEQVSMLSSKVENYDERISHTEKWLTHNNATWFQTFNRRFTNHHAFALERDNWRKRLSVPMTRPLLGYMADRACRIERELEGRLATSIEDMVLRGLVAKAVKGNTINVLEIGTLFATGAAIMYDGVRGHYENIHFTLLDPLEGYYHGSQSDILTGQVVDEAAVRRNLNRVGMDDSEFTLIKHLSIEPEAMAAAALRQYDVLVIDGDHSYAGVKTDFENYAKYVKVGGYIIFDDYSSPDWPDVQAYVDAEMDNVDFVAAVGSSWHTSVYRVVKEPEINNHKRQVVRPKQQIKAKKPVAKVDKEQSTG